MRRIQIDFSSRPSTGIRIGQRLGVIVLLAGLVLAALWTQHYLELRGDLAEWRDSLQRVDRHRSGQAPAQPAEGAARLKAELRRANRVIEALATPWPDLLGAAESAYSEQAILLSIEPDTERREVRLTAEAKDLVGMLDYLKALRQSPVLMDAVLVSHQINVKDNQRPVRFVVLAHWFDAPPPVPVAAPDGPAVAAPVEASR